MLGIDGASARSRRHAAAVIAAALLGAALAAGAYASSSSITIGRCGYAKTTYGKSGLYPWKMTCDSAAEIAVGSGDEHAKTIDFGPGWDGAAVKLQGSYWVCTGQMGLYECGYPYRPKKVKGERGYGGPFTKEVQFRTCSVEPGCPKTSKFTQPTS